jgi:hypothetical protein
MDQRTTIAAAVSTMSGLARWSEAPLPRMGPFPLYFDEDQPKYRCHTEPDERSYNSSASMRVAMADALPVVRPWKECAIRFEPPRPDKPLKQFLLLPPGAVSKTSARRARAEAILQAAYRAAAPRIETKPIWRPPANEPIDDLNRFAMLMDDEISDKISMASHERIYSADELATEQRWLGRYSSVKLDALAPPGTGADQSREERHRYDLWPYFTVPVGANESDLVRRPLTLHEIEYGFAKMTTLVTVLAQHKRLKKFVNAKTAQGRAYQAANFLLKIYWSGQRRVDTLYLIAARIVVQAVSLVLEIRDLLRSAPGNTGQSLEAAATVPRPARYRPSHAAAWRFKLRHRNRARPRREQPS